MTAKRILVAGIFQVVVLSLFAQDFPPTLTKQQMYKDFDEFVQIVDSSTQTLVRKIATGYDAAEEIRQRRSQIEKIKSYGEFIHFLNGCLPLTMAGHAQMAEDYQWRSGNNYIDTQIVVPLYQAYKEYVDKFPFDPIKNLKLGTGFYYKGGYYVDGKHVFINMETQDTTILSDFRVLKHNNEPISTLKNSQITGRSHWYRWDYELRQYYYVYGGAYIPRSDKIVAENYPVKKIIELDMKNCARMRGSSLSKEIIATLPEDAETDNMKVTYYDSLHLLYIYMGSMTEDDTFIDSIKKVGAGKQIDKVILDVRGNFGGSDAAWGNVLSAIIKKPLPIRGLIGFRNTDAMRKILEDFTKNYSDIKILKHKVSFLDNTEFLVFVHGGTFDNGDTMSYFPDTNSLQYDGKIYILQDKFVFMIIV